MENTNSEVNQEIKKKFVNREIIGNFNTEVETLLMVGNATFDYDCPTIDEITNFSVYPEYNGSYVSFSGGTYEEWQATIEMVQEEFDNLENQNDDFEIEIQELEDLEMEIQDIMEWWCVTSFLAEKLEALGEPILYFGMNSYWGRTTSGQAILLDSVISQICSDMEILEGQSNSWEKEV